MKQDDLFEVEEQPTRMQAFIDKHDIQTNYNEQMEPGEEWAAWMGDFNKWAERHILISGATRLDAMFELAKVYDLDGWKLLDWG